MRKFQLLIEAEDNEADGSESLEDIKKLFQNEVFDNAAYDISIKVITVLEIQPEE